MLMLQVDDCSVLRNIKKLLLNDYKNAVIVTSADKNARVIKTDPANTYWLTNVSTSYKYRLKTLQKRYINIY